MAGRSSIGTAASSEPASHTSALARLGSNGATFRICETGLAIHREFVNCTFSGELRDVRFSGRPVDYFSRNYRLAKMRPRREVNEFHGNDFRSADMVGVSFVFGVSLDDQLLPDGPEYIRLDQFSRRARIARSEIEGWDDRDARDEALRLLDIYQGMSESLQQDELFARKDELAAPIEVLECLWRLLEEKA